MKPPGVKRDVTNSPKKRAYYQQPIKITLRREHWHILQFAARQMMKKRKRELLNAPPFIPEPGRRNSNEEQIRKLNEAVHLITCELDKFDNQENTHA
jgi:hypothetical protein